MVVGLPLAAGGLLLVSVLHAKVSHRLPEGVGAFFAGAAAPKRIMLRAGLMDDARNVKWVFLGENDRRVLSIPPGVWHGYMVLGEEEAVLMYYITSKYDEKNPDEERMTPERRTR